MTVQVLVGDSRAMLATLPSESVHCIVTSPPYFGLRDYGHDGQIGLEPTPDAYVAEMVALFREARRVLRDDGTLWLNLGDSYAGGSTASGWREGSARADGNLRGDGQSRRNRNGMGCVDGLKPKDLIGIPWRVARALQEPFYTGDIKSETDRVWLAAMIDGEGCMFIHKRKVGQNNGQGYARKSDTYSAGLEVANTSLAIVERCLAITGRGSICRQDKDRKQPLYRWNLRSNECRAVIREIYPHLVAKQHQARLLLGCPSSGIKAEAAHAGLMALHNGQPCDIDFPAPESLFEPGWYLRAEIIWSKSNPMPESVTDRPTKAHEQVFLLSKSPRYFYDAEAIAEPALSDATKRGIKQNQRQTGEGYEIRRGLTNQAPRSHVNRRSVWTIATQPFSGAHFATMPPDLARDCILAGCPSQCCAKCGAPYERQVERTPMVMARSTRTHDKGRTRASGTMLEPPKSVTIGFAPSCDCNAGTVPGTVMDPFGGAGTTGLAADRLQRNAILVELNPEYAAIARERIAGDASLFAEVA